jgi:hypothetical protein
MTLAELHNELLDFERTWSSLDAEALEQRLRTTYAACEYEYLGQELWWKNVWYRGRVIDTAKGERVQSNLRGVIYRRARRRGRWVG